jgi:hypothetical protein
LAILFLKSVLVRFIRLNCFSQFTEVTGKLTYSQLELKC